MQNVDADEQMVKVPTHASFIGLYYLMLSGIDFDCFLPVSSELLVTQATSL